MSVIEGLTGELSDLGQVLGALDGDGDFQTDWLANPLQKLETVLSDREQRAAFLRLLDGLLPPAAIPGLPAGEKWHPLLGAQVRGNVYLTVRESGGDVLVGVAADLASTPGAGAAAGMRAQIPLVRAGTTVTAVAGTVQGPLTIDVRIEVGWVRDPSAVTPRPIGLHAIAVRASFDPDPSLRVVLESLQLDERPAADRVLDAGAVGRDSPELVAGLLKQVLAQAAPSPDIAVLVDHLLGLFGLGTSGVPPFPFAQLADGPAAVQGWLDSMLAVGSPAAPVRAWLTHLAGLMGTAATASGEGTDDDPWRIPVVPVGPDGALAFTLSRRNGTARLGVATDVGGTVAGGPRLALEGAMSIVDLPLAGTAPARPLPAGAVRVRVSGSGGAPVVDNPATVRVGQILAGVAWNGAAFDPLLALLDVRLGGTSYPRLDLTHVDSVVDTLAQQVLDTLIGALGPGVGRHLAAIAGLARPSDPADVTQPLPAWPHAIDVAQLVTDPTAAIAAYHRAVLLSGTQSWDFLLRDLAAMLGIVPAVSGAGTRNDPWRVPLAEAPVGAAVELVAWNDAAGSPATDAQRLRLGLRLAAGTGPLQAVWLAELLAFDLPATGAGSIAFVGAQRARISIEPAFDGPLFADVSASVDSLVAEASWRPGTSLAWSARAENVRVLAPEGEILVPALAFPPVAGFDVANLPATAAGLGLEVGQLESLVRLVLARLASAGSAEGAVIAACLGLHAHLPGLPADAPTIQDASAPGRTLSDPRAAMRDWLRRVAETVGADGRAYLPELLAWANAVLTDALPSLDSADGEPFEVPDLPAVAGAGTFADPWRLPWPGSGAEGARLQLWLEPDGPPSTWTAGIATGLAAASELAGIARSLVALAPFSGPLTAALTGRDRAGVTLALEALGIHLASGDGVVPVASQSPAIAGWDHGDPLGAAHHRLPQDASAIAQILARVDDLAGGEAGPRVVLLLGPAFLGADAWTELLASPLRHGSATDGAHFDLRVTGTDPLTLSLEGVTAVSDYYTADLADDGSGDLSRLTTQIDRIAARLSALRGDLPITLVAHSTAGVAARAYTATHRARVKGLITLGTPHVGAVLPFLTDPLVGDAVRIAHAARGAGASGTPTREALDHLLVAIDGYAGGAPGALSRKQVYPFASFNAVAPFDTGDVPVLALGSTLPDALPDVLAADGAALATALATPARTATHLAGGIALPMELTAAPVGEVAVDASLRVGLFQIPLQAGAPRPARAAHLLRAEARIHRGDGWLLGGPSTFPSSADLSNPRLAFDDVRARRIVLGFDLPSAGAGAAPQPFFSVVQGAHRGPTHDRLADTDALGHQILGVALHALGRDATGASPAQQLLEALRAIEVVVTDAHGIVGLSADAWVTLTSDPLRLLGAKLPAAVARPGGWLGVQGPPDGPWTWSAPASPIELVVSRAAHEPWRLALRSAAGTAPGTTPRVRIGLDVASELPLFAPTAGVELSIGPLALRFDASAETLALRAPPWLADLQLLPAPGADELGARLNDALPRVLFSGALSLILGAIVPGARVGAVERFLRSTGDYLRSGEAFGRADGPSINGAKVAQLLRTINDLAGLPAADGLQLPADLSLVASGDGTDADPLALSLATVAPIGGVLVLAAGLRFDSVGHTTPTGTITVDTPLGGTWPRVAVRFGVDASGLSLSVLPEGQPPIQILPSFSGLGALRGAITALLPQVLDALVEELGAPPPEWLARLLDVATALQLYDDAGKFAGHTAQLQALLAPGWRDTFDASLRSGVATAAAALTQAIPALLGTASASGAMFTWSLAVGAPDRRIGVSLGWTGDDPTVRLFCERVELATGVLRASLALGAAPTGLDCSGALAVSLAAIGLTVRPTLAFSLDSAAPARFRLRALPLADATRDGPLEIVLAPDVAVNSAAGTPLRLVGDYLLPLVVRAVVEAERGELGRRLWTGGPTVQEALVFAGLLDGASQVAAPLPSPGRMVTGLLSGLATGPSIALGTLELGLVSSAGRVGLRLGGHQDIGAGSLDLSMRFGAPTSWTTASGTDPGTPDADGGLELLLLRTDGADFELDVGLRLAGVGIGMAGQSGTKLIDTSLVRIGELRAYLFMDVETSPSLAVEHLGAGAELIGFGLPLGAATSGNVGGDNPVASNLLRSDGATAGGDSRPVNPDVDVDVWYWEPPGSTGNPLHVRFGGEGGGATIWIGVHSGFGPIYVDQVGIGATSEAASLLIDGGVKVAGLAAEVDDLTVRIPYADLGDPTRWSLDLKGLGLGFTAPGVTITGALVKFDGPPIEYDGMLLIKVAQIGALAVGSYAVVGTGTSEYTSLAIFGGVFVPIGIPPIINLTGVGVGLGYNRRLVVPEDLNQIPRFFLVAALDRPEAIANNPMQALFSFRDSVPPSRGSLWLAAGLRGTSFEVIHVTAVLYAALDRGMEIGLLGVARMALPPGPTPLASVEVALKARFSSAEGLFSVQAQLTDNSWLLSPDCQLTGGFALLYWFRESQLLFTLGGYHPAFQRRPEYPEVPRLGYHWNVLGLAQLKGETYFAITTSCVMAGMRLEATYGADWLQLWFTGHADFLIARDPFHYAATIGISVGARARIKVCFFKCVRITVSVSVGAELTLEGPPLHGVAEIDLCVASVTIPFGDESNPPPPLLPWEPFRLKYLLGADAETSAVSAQVAAGLLPSEPPGGKVAAGTPAEPWRLAAEWTLRTETRMPARGFAFQNDEPHSEAEMTTVVFGRYARLGAVYAFDIAPMGVGSGNLDSIHRIVLNRKPEAGGSFAAMVPRTSPSLPADRTFVLDERMLRVRPTIGQVSEATYHYFPDLKPPAAANTLPALLGLEIEGVAFMIHPSAVIPIAKLRDATNARLLPFAHDPPIVADWKVSGIEAEAFATLAHGRSGRRLMDGYARVLAGNGDFSARRVRSNLPVEGLSPVAARALRTRRSSPPMLSTLSFGLAMRSPEQPLPPVVAEVTPQAPVALTSVRLRAVMQPPIAPTRAVAPTVRMTVDRVARARARSVPPARVNVGRDLLRTVAVPGARLLVHASPTAPRATLVARNATSVRSAELGATVGRAISRVMREAEDAAQASGTPLRAGVTQLWDVPPGDGRMLLMSRRSGMAARVTLLGSGGALLSDDEYPGPRDVRIALPESCVMVAVTGLGGNRSLFAARGSRNGAQPGPGAVTSHFAPAGATPAVGWELRQHVPRLSPTLLLGRGVTIALSQPSGASAGKQVLGVGMSSLVDALRGQTAIETTLALGTRVVGVLLDLEVGGALSRDALVVGVSSARLSPEPVRVEAGNRVLLLYDVTPDVAQRERRTASVTVAVRGGGRCAGVVGLGGDARGWGERMNGRVPETLVPDAPLTADGEAQLRFVLPAREERRADA